MIKEIVESVCEGFNRLHGSEEQVRVVEFRARSENYIEQKRFDLERVSRRVAELERE
ncbi:MAG: hypothetical protein LM590_13140 [Thermofilum sp.]|nr:hypothetical protein [Thermofilum sp.]